jgi:hypothetical protein
MIVRKHRLWEVFLVEKLGFSWDEVHDIAEQLEHIKSEKLINKLDDFLDNPTEDPHGDPYTGQGRKNYKNRKAIAFGIVRKPVRDLCWCKGHFFRIFEISRQAGNCFGFKNRVSVQRKF